MSAIRPSEVYETIALPKELGGWGFVMTIEVAYVRKCSSDTNKLRYVHSIGNMPRDIAIKEGEISYIKINIFQFINFSGICTIRYE